MELKMIEINKLHTNPLQPRQDFDREKLQELASSIKESDLLQPIVVRRDNSGFEIVAGERRYKAFQILKEPKIPAIVWKAKDDIDALEKSLIENLQRDDLKSVERENAVYELWKSGRYKTHREIAKKLGLGKSRISQLIETKEFRDKESLAAKLSTRTIYDTSGLPDESRKKIVHAVEEKKIEPSKVRDVVQKVKEFPEPEQQIEILDEFEKQEKWSRDAFDAIIEEKKRIAKGERPPEWQPPSEENRWFLDDMKRDFDKIYGYGVGNLDKLPKKQRDEAVDVLAKSLIYLMGQLVEMGEIETVRRLYEEKIRT